MEKTIDFDQWLAEYTPPKIEYFAVFDPISGEVRSVGPSHAFVDEQNKISIDQTTAEDILSGKIRISSCFINFSNNTLENTEVKHTYKIDDVLHRIIDVKWSKIEKPDLHLTYNSKKKILKIELSEELGGTKKLLQKFYPLEKKKIVWDGETEMNFLITEYNDPNLIFEMVSVKINDLLGKAVEIKNIDYNIFSIYTRRIFKNCTMTYK